MSTLTNKYDGASQWAYNQGSATFGVPYTIVGRLYAASLGSSITYVNFEQQFSGAESFGGVLMNSSNQLLAYSYRLGSSEVTFNVVSTFSAATWYSIVFRHTSLTSRDLFFNQSAKSGNGYASDTTSIAGTTNLQEINVAIFKKNGSEVVPLNFYPAVVCDVGIFTRSLSDAEVVDYIDNFHTAGKIGVDYDAGHGSGTSGLIFWPKDFLDGYTVGMEPSGCDVTITQIASPTTQAYTGAGAHALVYPSLGNPLFDSSGTTFFRVQPNRWR